MMLIWSRTLDQLLYRAWQRFCVNCSPWRSGTSSASRQLISSLHFYHPPAAYFASITCTPRMTSARRCGTALRNVHRAAGKTRRACISTWGTTCLCFPRAVFVSYLPLYHCLLRVLVSWLHDHNITIILTTRSTRWTAQHSHTFRPYHQFGNYCPCDEFDNRRLGEDGLPAQTTLRLRWWGVIDPVITSSHCKL